MFFSGGRVNSKGRRRGYAGLERDCCCGEGGLKSCRDEERCGLNVGVEHQRVGSCFLWSLIPLSSFARAFALLTKSRKSLKVKGSAVMCGLCLSITSVAVGPRSFIQSNLSPCQLR